MEVILLERLEKLGQIGDIVRVKPGFARNYLLPRGKALRATPSNKNFFEEQRSQLEADNLKLKNEATNIASRMEDMLVTLIRQAGDAGQLYGSVNTRNIAQAVVASGFTILRQQVILPSPIKVIGVHNVKVHLHPEISVNIKVNVARSEEEAKTQSKTGIAVLSIAEIERTEADTDHKKIKEEIFDENTEIKESLANDEPLSDKDSSIEPSEISQPSEKEGEEDT